MKSRIGLLTVFLVATIAGSPAFAEPQWTFCVASAAGTKDVWLTEVFAANVDRERLETALKSLLERVVHLHVVAQCPLASDDKVAVVNAQTAAEEFNRKLGSALHSVPAHDFPTRP